MSEHNPQLLASFLSWASAVQQRFVRSPYNFSVKLDSPKASRTASIEVLLYRQEDGWVTDELLMFGTLMIWDTGSVDAEVWDEAATKAGDKEPTYFENWHPIDPSQFDANFYRFLSFFKKVLSS